MNRKKSIVLATVFGFLAAAFVWVEEPVPTVTLSVEEIARQVQSRNLAIFEAARTVEKAQEDLIGEPELVNSTLSTGLGYTASSSGAAGWYYGQSGLNLRVVPQLSTSATVMVDQWGVFSESVSITVSPFEPPRQTYSEERVLAGALVQERYLKRRIYFVAEQAAMNLLVSDMERELARATEDLEQKKYELAQRRQDIGEASFQDVQDQLVNLIDAREDLFSKESGYLGDWRTLQLLFAPSEERIAVAPLKIADVMEMVEGRRDRVKALELTRPVSEGLEYMKLDLTALEAALKATPLWNPDLNLAAAVDLPYGYSGSRSVGVGLSFSPNQIKRKEREDLRKDIKIKRMEIEAETSAALLEKSLEQQNIALVEQALASAQAQVERDETALQEGELLFKEGRRTTLELEQLRLNLRKTQILTFSSAVEVYRVLGVYQMLFVGQ